MAVVADLLDLTARRIQQLAAEGVLPRAARGRYNLAACVRAYVQYQRRELESLRARQNGGTPDGSLIAERTIKTFVERQIAEVHLDKLRGDLIPTSAHRDALRLFAHRIRAQLLAAPGRYAPRTAGKTTLPESQRAWDAAVRDILNALRDDGTPP